ncbi:MAG: fibronectin type III domain-containing protein, partial [Candidatus Sumerlaeaceae bacterium]
MKNGSGRQPGLLVKAQRLGGGGARTCHDFGHGDGASPPESEHSVWPQWTGRGPDAATRGRAATKNAASAVSGAFVCSTFARNHISERLPMREPGAGASRGSFRPGWLVRVALAACSLWVVFGLTGCFEREGSNVAVSPTPSLPPPPPAPRGLQAFAASPTEVILEWEQPTTGVTRLSLERKGGANTDFVTVMEKLPANEIGYIDNVQPETAYTYRLFAWAGEVRSNEPAGPVTVTTPPYPPAPPAWIKAEAQGPRRVAISWGEAPRAKKFTLLRADEKTGEFLSIATLENKQIYTDDEVAPETRYWYKVRAANENPETTESKVVSVVTPREGAAASAREAAAEEIAPTPRPRPLAQPTIVEAVVDVDGVLLRWEQAARNASYAVMRTYDLGVPFVTLDVVDGVTNFIDRRVSPGRSYYYKIRAYAPDGRTAESEIVRVDLDVPGSSPVVIGAPPELPPPPVIGGVVIDVSIAPLEPPRRLEVRQPAPDRVELRWHGAQGADRFYILRSERGSRWF